MASVITEPWVIIGDCNIVLYEYEKQSRCPLNQTEADMFIDMSDNIGLQDLGFKGYPYTWSNKRQGLEFT